MTNKTPHIPALRRGRPYQSLETGEVTDAGTGAVQASISQVNAGIIRRDLQKIEQSRRALKAFKVTDLLEICRRAGELFRHEKLPLGDDGSEQSVESYVQTLSLTSGFPQVMVRRNMDKIHSVLTNMPTIVKGLTRGLDPDVLDRGIGEQSGVPVSFYPATSSLGVVMPSNSPAVNSLWLPSVALKIPVILKPGRDEPWTPYRLIQSFIAAGCPPEAFGFYPTDHEGAASILESCGRALIFGDKKTTAPYENNPAIQIHGPGYSKVLVGEDAIDDWPDWIDVMVDSISDNGGRSCINASTIVVPRHGAEIADALARRLGPIAPKPADDDEARLCGFPNPKMAEAFDGAIERDLQTPGATEITARYREGPRKIDFGGIPFLRPTIIHCDRFDHPLANREFLFPYASVVEVPQTEMLERIGPSLVVTAITQDAKFMEALMESTSIDRLNIGPISTMKISWDQPHEGNLFEFLYKRRAIEIAKK